MIRPVVQQKKDVYADFGDEYERVEEGKASKGILTKLKEQRERVKFVKKGETDPAAWKTDFKGWYYQWVFRTKQLIGIWAETKEKYEYFKSYLCFFGALSSVYNSCLMTAVVTNLFVLLNINMNSRG